MQQYADIYSLHSECLHTVASRWTFLLTLNHDARNHEFKKLNICAKLSSYVDSY